MTHALPKSVQDLLTQASGFMDQSLIESLQENGFSLQHTTPHGQTSLMSAAVAGNELMVSRLLRDCEAGLRDALLHEQDTEGRTALHHAAQRGNSQTLVRLLKAGANVLVTTHDGKTAGALARESGHTELADLLDGMAGRKLQRQLQKALPQGTRSTHVMARL